MKEVITFTHNDNVLDEDKARGKNGFYGQIKINSYSLVFEEGTAKTALDISFLPDVLLLDLVLC